MSGLQPIQETVQKLSCQDPTTCKDSPPITTLEGLSNKKQKPSARPSLLSLRSAWSSQTTTLGETAAAAASILRPELILPLSIFTYSPEHEHILVEIHKIALFTTVLCFSTTVATLSFSHVWPIHGADALLVVGWGSFTIWSLCRPITCCSLKLGQLSAMVTAIVNHKSPAQTSAWISSSQATWLYVAGAGLFYSIYRMYKAHNKSTETLQQQALTQQALVKAHIDDSIAMHTERRTAFIKTMSEEVQDSALMVLTTLEQFLSSSFISNTHELLSACSIHVPITSISAIYTTLRHVCHMSAQPHLIYQLVKQSTVDSSHQESLKTVIMQSFDIGELVQRVGDAMAGMASGLDVGLVIYHSDDSLHHVTMMGDEDAIQHMLISLLRNILEGCTPGACIELGLSVVSDAPKFKVTFDIIHTASPAIPVGLSATLLPNANFTTQLIQYIKCNMVVEDMGKNKTRFVIQLEADAGHKHTTKKPLGKPLTSIPCSHEPTLKELTHFIRQLKGVKLVLYAAKQSMFAKHLTSSLASWNTDISHIPTHVWDEDSQQLKQEEVSSQSSQSSMHTAQSSFSVGSQCSNAFFNSQRTSNQTQVPSPALEEDNIRAIPPAFILIDDDVATLKARLYELYTQPLPFSPTLQLHTQGRRKHKPQTPNSLHQKTTAIIFFTSLYNYKHVRDILRRLIPSYQTSVSIPRVVVVPKPAGPRRFLTALHTAWSNAMVEPQFMPIATSPSHLLTSPVLSGTNGSAVATSTPGPESVDNGEASLGISISAGTDINTTAGTNTPGGMMDLTNFNTIASSRVKTSPATGPEVFSSPFRDDSIATDLSSRHKANNGFYTSPSGLAAETIFEKGNYFFDPIRTPSAMTPGSPSNRHTHSQNSAFLSSNRHPLNDQTILPEFIAVQGSPYGQLSPGGSPFKQAIHAMENQGLPIVPIEDTVLDNGNAVLMSPDVSDSTRTVQAVQEKGKETTKKSMRFKISHRKKKEKDKSASGVSSPPINVLIVEDNMINQVILSTWMKRHSIKYEVASNGKEAVEKWQKGGFHLVLMDIQLPVMNGLEATKTIRSIEKEQRIGVLPSAPPSFHHQKSNDSASSDVLSLDVGEDTTPGHMQVLPLPPSPFRSPVIIVALTASSLESDRQAALAAGCNDFLTKPVSLEWLEKKIMEWGCMQALIDFEGWRKWKQTAQPTHLRKSSSAVAKEKTPEPTIQRIPQRQGILLPGVSSLVKRGDDRSSRPKRSSRKISSMS